MKSVEIGEAKGTLADYARDAQRETLVVTRRGRPVAAVVPIRGVDMESLALSTNPAFLGLIERARTHYKATGGVSLEEMRRRWGPDRKPRKGRARARAATPSRAAASRSSR
jgi:prevent-host-death family protein